jgi:hypothetical protein
VLTAVKIALYERLVKRFIARMSARKHRFAHSAEELRLYVVR